LVRDGNRLERAELGLLGEDLAAVWLRRNGRKVLYRNFRAPHGGEVDVVCRHKDVLVFNEVKTRTSDAFGRPADAVNPDKQRLIQRGASEWMRLLGRPKIKFRFDIVEVLLINGELPKVNVIENAFQMPESSIAGR
jgi:Holliday junction resolvase-like predicted endonuclease